MTRACDVLIVGGGPVGICAGALLARAGRTGPALRVGLLQAAATPADGRVLAISRASERILDAAGAWPAIAPHAWAYERMRVWYAGMAASSDEVLQFDAAEVGEPNLGHIIETHRITNALVDSFVAAGGEVIQGELRSASVESGAPGGVRLQTSAGELTAQLIVGADGARSAVRTAFGIATRTGSYEQTAIVARVTPERSHQNTAWQRFITGGTLALLPLADGSVSIVWSLRAAQARALLEATNADFEAQLLQHSDGALGSLRLASPRLAFALQRLTAERYIAPHCALIGDAAHVVHPLAGQGVNLGLLDAAALAQLCVRARASGELLGAQRTLRAYERWRKGENQLMEFAIDAFNRVLAQGVGPLSALARRALVLTNRSALLKRFFIGHALGQAPELTAWESDPAWQRR
ncbi:MAG TPA: FAD-dependent monooxygenase [Steroidobacteraceae bacterium]|jgi:2-octaprenylphenol hydroxylase|nr:FAD-dependent monooxygenase [Steroidobacteraceae bacterium]